MMLKRSSLTFLLTALVTTASLCFSTSADEIKLKNGETISGRLVFESEDFVRIEVAISASIKETKLVSRSEIAEIVKEAPDNVEFAKLEKILPTGSLLPAGAYQSMITTGPKAFLSAFPDSKHVEKVEEIKATLEGELDKIERGYVKIEGEWISPQQKAEFKALTNSKVQLLSLKRFMAGGNYNSLIGAMRSFEILEGKFYGTPAFADSIDLAVEVIPLLGSQLQKLSRDVEYRNAEFQRKRDTLDEVGKAQIDAALAQEEAQLEAAIGEDKQNGIKWITLNSRSKDAIDTYIQLAVTELERIKQLDSASIKDQSEQLVAVDEMIAEGELATAKTKLVEAAALSGKSLSRNSRKSNSGPSSYIAALNLKLNERFAAEEEKLKAEEEAAASKSLADNLKKADEDEGEDREGSEEEINGDEKTPKSVGFNALSGANTNKKASVNEEKAKSKSSSGSEREDRPQPPALEDEGGFSLGLLVPILTVVLIIVVVLLKVLGIGGAKKDSP
tara:strand:+ start:1165 stop:2676 length:1512 start_codon:yes stop_codon:yes gene_type:complete